jgi:Glycosyltransferase family 87
LTIADESAQRWWRTSRYLSPLLLIACVLAGAKFIVRGPARAASGSGDLKAIYLPSRAWLHGLDPYDEKILGRMWVDAGEEEGTAPARWGAPSVYPPTALALLSPLSALPWRFAQPIWCGLNLAGLAVLLICMHQLAGVRWFEARSLCMIAMMLAFEPASTTIALGQPSIIVAALAAASLVAGTRGRESRSGLLEGLALGLKPQLAIAFAAPYVFARRWRYVVVVAATVAIVGGVALVRLVADSHWITSYLANLRFAFGPGGANDAGPLNPNRIEFINLGYLFSLILTSRPLCEGLAWLVGLSLALPGLKELVRRPTGVMLLECVALLAAVELLVFYHKAYDAAVLAFPMVWALSPAVPIRRSWPVLLALGCYLLPGGVAVQLLGQSHYVPRAISSSIVWQTIILPYQAWALLIITGWMSYSLVRSENGVGAAVSGDRQRREIATGRVHQ